MVTPTANSVLELLRKLPPRERLKVISQALPEVERSLAGKPRKLKTLHGLWKDYRFAPSEKDIDEIRDEVWNDFPREDIA